MTPAAVADDMPSREHSPAVLALLWAARETGLLETLLTESATPREAAASAGVTERAATVTVATLVDEGYLAAVDGGYEPTNRSLGLLTTTDVRSIGETPRAIDVFDALTDLPETMRTGSLPGRGDDWDRHELGAAAATDESTVDALVTAALEPGTSPADVLVLGGAPGHLAREFDARGCDVTLVDGSDAVAATRPLLGETAVECVTAPATELPPERFDLVVAADYTHRLSVAENRHLVDAARDLLTPGGHLVLFDRLRGRSPGATGLDVEALATTAGGRAYGADSYRSWLAAADFEAPTVRDVPGTDRQSVVARRPRD